MTVKRYLRLIGGEHHGKVAPSWIWRGVETGPGDTVKLPIVPKPRIIVHQEDIGCSVHEGPDYQTYARRTIPLTRGAMFEAVYFECWSLEELPDGDVRGLLVDMLFEAA